jgi:hypothetical protein
VNFEELDIALEELETRLERLRALYEQYFMGFEKIEPAVARKDVDRRIYVLRREKIRNTGKRFKLQTIIMRYNTFQQYWQRICREIENGTYKRHLARAERIMGPEQLLTIAARRRFGKSTIEKLAAGAEVSDVSPIDDIEDGMEGIASAPPPPVFAEQGFDPAPLPPIPRVPSAFAPPPSATLPPNPEPRTQRPSKYESLKLDMDFLDSWNPETSVRSRNRDGRPKAGTPPEPSPEAPFPPAPSSVSNEAPEPPTPPRSAPPPKPASPARLQPPPKPASPARAQPPPKPVSPPRAAPPNAAERPAARPAASAAKPSTLSDDRIRELHETLVRIKRENKESGQVSVESLAKTLRATEEKLRTEHKNRRIEFEVVLRDGKAVVKPRVR